MLIKLAKKKITNLVFKKMGVIPLKAYLSIATSLD